MPRRITMFFKVFRTCSILDCTTWVFIKRLLSDLKQNQPQKPPVAGRSFLVCGLSIADRICYSATIASSYTHIVLKYSKTKATGMGTPVAAKLRLGENYAAEWRRAHIDLLRTRTDAICNIKYEPPFLKFWLNWEILTRLCNPCQAYSSMENVRICFFCASKYQSCGKNILADSISMRTTILVFCFPGWILPLVYPSSQKLVEQRTNPSLCQSI